MGQAAPPPQPQEYHQARRPQGYPGNGHDNSHEQQRELLRERSNSEHQRLSNTSVHWAAEPSAYADPMDHMDHSTDHVDHGLVEGSTIDKAQELCNILKSLEGQLENPTDYGVIGRTYKRLAEWTWEHQQDSDFPDVLQLLAPESMYPAWRRQALEEAYMLFFEDCAKQGNPRALEQLPEPPTSKEIGYRPLPEALLDPKTTRGAAFTNHYEAGNACCIRRRWDYDVVRNGPRAKPGEKRAVGRKIIPKDNSERYCACAVDPMTKLMQIFVPEAMCCGRDRKVPSPKPDAGAAPPERRPQPQQVKAGSAKVPSGNKPPWGTAAVPPSSMKMRPKPGSEPQSARGEPQGQWPAPPGEEEVPHLAESRRGRAEQAFSTHSLSKEPSHEVTL